MEGFDPTPSYPAEFDPTPFYPAGWDPTPFRSAGGRLFGDDGKEWLEVKNGGAFLANEGKWTWGHMYSIVCTRCTFGVPAPGPDTPPSAYYCTCRPGDGPMEMIYADGYDPQRPVAEGMAGDEGFGEEGASGEQEMGEDVFEREESAATSGGDQDSEGDEDSDIILTNAKSSKNLFKNSDEAAAYLWKIKHKVMVEDDDWEEVEAHQPEWFDKLFNAMIKLRKDASDTDKNVFKTIQKKGYTEELIQASAWAIIRRTLQIHQYGSELEARSQLDGKTIAQMKASERLNNLVDILYDKKNVVKDVLDSWKLRLIVDQPIKRLARAKQTKKCNDEKKERLMRTREENKQFKSSSSNMPRSTPSSGITEEESPADPSADTTGGGEDFEEGGQGAGTDNMIVDGWAGGSSPPLPDGFGGEAFSMGGDERVAEAGGLSGPTTRSAGKKGKAPAYRDEGGGESSSKAPRGRKPEFGRD